MTATKDLLSLATTMQAADLLSHVAKKRKRKNLFGTASDIIVGSALIGAESNIIGGMQ